MGARSRERIRCLPLIDQFGVDLFEGLNVFLPSEGNADLEGQSKPVLVGKVDSVEPAYLKDGNLGYLIDPDKVDALLASGTGVGDKEVFQGGRSVGVAGTDYTSSEAHGRMLQWMADNRRDAVADERPFYEISYPDGRRFGSGTPASILLSWWATGRFSS